MQTNAAPTNAPQANTAPTDANCLPPLMELPGLLFPKQGSNPGVKPKVAPVQSKEDKEYHDLRKKYAIQAADLMLKEKQFSVKAQELSVKAQELAVKAQELAVKERELALELRKAAGEQSRKVWALQLQMVTKQAERQVSSPCSKTPVKK